MESGEVKQQFTVYNTTLILKTFIVMHTTLSKNRPLNSALCLDEFKALVCNSESSV